RQAELVGLGGIILEALVVGGLEAEQARNVVALEAGLFLGRRIGIEIGAERDAQAGALVGVIFPVFVVLGIVALAVPLAAEAAADEGELDAVGLGFFPVDLTLIFGHVDALAGRGQDGLARVVEVKAVFVFGPGALALAHIGHGRGLAPA